MKSKNEKPKKKLETNIGKIIYGFLLFMPLLAIGVTCAYAIFNKNAYMSYAEDKVQNVTQINSNNYLMENNTYSINKFLIAPSNYQTPIFTYKSISIDWVSVFNAPDNYNYDGFMFRTAIETGNKFVYLYENGVQVWENHTANINYFNSKLPLTFVLESYSGGTTNWYNYISTSLISYKSDSLSNVFYYSIDKVEQSPLFNWSKNSLIYTGMSNTAQALDISNTFIPMLLTYWLIISVFYYLYDIILIILHVFHRKIHELEESI